jgi:hypothetical protein
MHGLMIFICCFIVVSLLFDFVYCCLIFVICFIFFCFYFCFICVSFVSFVSFVSLLFHCCFIVVSLLFHCCFIVVSLLFHFCFIFVSFVFHFCVLCVLCVLCATVYRYVRRERTLRQRATMVTERLEDRQLGEVLVQWRWRRCTHACVTAAGVHYLLQPRVKFNVSRTSGVVVYSGVVV